MNSAPPSLLRRALPFLKAVGALAAIGYIVQRQPWPELVAAVKQLSPLSMLASAAIMLVGLGCGALRWRMVLVALGATAVPPLGTLLRMYAVGSFYNTYLPFAVGGDLMRGVVARTAFGTRGVTASLASVLVERMLGLSAVLVLTLVALAIHGDRVAGGGIAASAAVALPLALGAAFALPLGRRLAPYLPGPLGARLAELPRVERYSAFMAALLISLCTQLAIVFATHTLARSAYPGTALADSLFAAPLAAAAAYLPISFAGIGPRDVVLVALYGVLGMPRAAGTATALALLVVSLLVALLGGMFVLADARNAPKPA